MQIIEGCGKWKYEITAGQCIFGIPTVDRISSEDGRIAKVFETPPTIPTLLVRSPDPGNAHTRAPRKFMRSSAHDFADNLMTRN
jgi:hypothetical protein